MSEDTPIPLKRRRGRPRKSESEAVRKRIVELWSSGKELSDIVATVNEETRGGVTLNDVFKALREVGVSVSAGSEEVVDVFDWLFNWQLDRLKMYKELERQMGVPIPDVRSNISLMLMLLERRSRAADVKKIDEFLKEFVEGDGSEAERREA
jgi:hypothetical protein